MARRLITDSRAATIDVTFFQHHRAVEHRDGTRTVQLAPVRKSIDSLSVLRELELRAGQIVRRPPRRQAA
jgi:hypothetical protein